MKRGDSLIRAIAVVALVAASGAVGCNSGSKSDPVTGPARGDRSAGKSGGDVHAGSGARYSGMSDAPPVDTQNTWAVSDEKLLPPSPLRGEARPMPSKGGCIPAGYNIGSTAFPTGNVATSAILVEKGVPPQVVKGEEFDFVICATNLTDHDLNNVMISDVLSDGWVLRSSTPKYREDLSAKPTNVYVWDLQTLAPGETRTIQVRALPTQEGTINACATVQYESGVCVATNVVNPALQLVKTGTDTAGACDEITYTYRVTNSGTGTARNVVITDDLASGLTTQSGKGDVRIDVGTLAAGQTREFALTANAPKPGRYASKANATGEPGLRAESAVVSTTVTKPSLEITQRCDDDMYLGRNADTDITVTNKGDGVARATTIEATLPSGATFVSASDNGRLAGSRVVWNVGDLAPKASKKVNLAYSSTAPGAVRINTSANATCADAVSANCSTEFQGIPAILVECIDLEDPDEVGTTETYVITVTNQGSARDTNIRLVCEVPGAMSYVSATGPTEGTARGQTVTFAPLATLAPKDKAVWRVTVKNNQAGQVRFEIKVTSDQFNNPPIMETEATNIYQ